MNIDRAQRNQMMQLINETETQALAQLCQLSTAFHSQIGGLLAAPQKQAGVHSDATISTPQPTVKKPASSLSNPERKQPSGRSEHTEPCSVNRQIKCRHPSPPSATQSKRRAT